MLVQGDLKATPVSQRARMAESSALQLPSRRVSEGSAGIRLPASRPVPDTSHFMAHIQQWVHEST